MRKSKLLKVLHQIANDVFEGIGVSFGEEAIQKAMAIEFKNRMIHYMRESSNEVLYHCQAVYIDKERYECGC